MSSASWVPLAVSVDWGVWATVATGALALVIYLLQKRSKRRALAFSVRARTLVQVGEEARAKVEVFYDGTKVVDVHLVEIDVVNAGRVPIRAADFERAIEISLPLASKPLPSTLTATGEPVAIGPNVTPAGDAIQLAPLLLNPGDTVTVSVLTESAPALDDVAVDGRIVGVKDFKRAAHGGLALPATLRIWLPVIGPIELRSMAELISVALSGLVVIAILAGIGALRDPETGTSVTLANGQRFCAKDTKDLSNGGLLVVRVGGRRQTFEGAEVITAEPRSCKAK